MRRAAGSFRRAGLRPVPVWVADC
ncbi:antitoxin MazE-like protein [Maricaulis sp.]